jgi:hypothetical protein
MMKRALVVFVTFACAATALLAAQGVSDQTKALQSLSAPIKTDGGEFMIVVLTDPTVEAIFGTSPTKVAIRTRSHMATILFIEGVAKKDFDFKPDVTVTQKGETLEGKASSMKNFTAGKITKGTEVQGLVELPKKLNLYDPFKVTMNGQTAEVRLDPDAVREYAGKQN